MVAQHTDTRHTPHATRHTRTNVHLNFDYICSDNEEYVGTAGFKARGNQAGGRRKTKRADPAGDGDGGGAAEVAEGVAGMTVATSEGGAADGAAGDDSEGSDLDSEEEAKLLYDNEEYTGSHPHLAKKKGVRRGKKKTAAATAAAVPAEPVAAAAAASADC